MPFGADTPTPEFVGNSRVRGARSPPGTHGDLTTPSPGTAGRRRCAPAAGPVSGRAVCPAGGRRASGGWVCPVAAAGFRAAVCPDGRSASGGRCTRRAGGGFRAGVPGRGSGGLPGGGSGRQVYPPGEKKPGFFPAPTRMYKEARPPFSQKKPLTFRPGRVMDVRAGQETAHKAQPGRAGEAATGRKETPMKTQTFGIEIEMNHITRQRAAQVVAETLGEGATFRHTGGAYDAWEVTAPDGRRWKLVSDASIAGPRDQGTEFVSPICRWEDIETVQACVRALRAAGAHADPSCGIHVHVGLGEHTPKTLRNLVNLVNAKEDLLTQALQISPERRSRWCQPVDPDFLATLNRRRPTTSEEFARIWYDDRDWAYHAHQHYDPSRYHLLNLHSVFQKGTIEFRAFNSTLHAGEVKAYIQLCLAISHQALTVASASPARPVTDNPAYTFRCWLLRLGMNGEEFKTARTHLLKHLPGNAAWRNGAETTRRAS